MKDLTVIIPIHKVLTDAETELLKKAQQSISSESTTQLYVGPKEALDKIEMNEKWVRVENDGDTSFSRQINLAVDKVKTKYFSVLEFDDTYTPIWEKNVKKYINKDVEDISIYLPLTEVLVLDETDKNNTGVGFVNEAVWASAFSERMGYLDLESLMDYGDFNVTGGVIKTEDFISVGKLKESIKVSFWYEFLLRLLNKGKKVFVIPKLGYIHYSNRKGSLIDTYRSTMSDKEIDWWIDLAKKEYLFPRDRNKTYEEETK